MFRRRKRPAGRSWRMGETYVKISGQWKYLYRTVDRPVQVLPLAADLHVGLVHPPTQANWALAPTDRGRQQRQHLDRPAMQRAVIDEDPALGLTSQRSARWS